MQGGKGSTASRRTYRELAPSHAAGKVPVLGAESAGGEPQGSKLVADGEAFGGACNEVGPLAAAQPCRECPVVRALTQRGSLSLCLLPIE